MIKRLIKKMKTLRLYFVINSNNYEPSRTPVEKLAHELNIELHNID